MADQAQKNAAGKKYRVLLSNPCYEVWTLAHLTDTGEHFNDCKAVVSRIRTEWKKAFGSEFGPKAQADYEKLMRYRDTAILRAEKGAPAAISRGPKCTGL